MLLASAAALGLLLADRVGRFVQPESRIWRRRARDAAAAVKVDKSAAAPARFLRSTISPSSTLCGNRLKPSAAITAKARRSAIGGDCTLATIFIPKSASCIFSDFFSCCSARRKRICFRISRRCRRVRGPTDSYQYPYDSLKSYLITTSNHDKSTKQYLSPLLYSRWEAGKTVDAARSQLVRKQFDFYADELKYANPFGSENDAASVDHARKYLAQFAGTERVYRFMLAEANKAAPLNFNQKFPGSAQTVVNNRDVTGAFTKVGWPVMQDAIKHADKYFAGEQWVLGDQSANVGDLGKLTADLQKLYTTDYGDQWRDYLKKSVVVGYGSISDAAKKLAITASPQSPLLAMFCMASQNVGVDPSIASSFKPLLAVVPASCGDQYVGPTNQDYMKALSALQIGLGQISGANPDPNDPNVAQAATNATAAKVVTGQMAQNFGVDPLAATVQKLIEDPIAHVEPLVKGLGRGGAQQRRKESVHRFPQPDGQVSLQRDQPE